MGVKRQEGLDDPHAALATVRASLESCRMTTGREMVVVGLGGMESLVSLMAACDVYGPHSVLAIGVYSVFSDSRMPTILQQVGMTMPISVCTVDATETMQEIMNANIGLRRIEIERMHYSMDQWQKAELMAAVRSTIVRGVATRHRSTHIESHSLSKIVGGWVLPSTFDWNPVAMCTRRQLATVANRQWPDDEILSLSSGLDLWPDGGPRPTGVDLDAIDPEPSPRSNITGFVRAGLGIWQPEASDGD